MLLDEEAERIELGADRADRPTLLRWVKELLADRRARTTLLQGQTRRVNYTKRRLQQATAYLTGLLEKAEAEASTAWPGRLPCPHCGAPAALVTSEQRASGHALVYKHPGGGRCEGQTTTVLGATAPNEKTGRAKRGP